MEFQRNSPSLEKRPGLRKRAPAVRWFREWVPQPVLPTGGKCALLKWVTEDTLKSLRDKHKESEPKETEPEPTTEVLFLCNYEGCGKTFIDIGALKKHSHIHGERQHVCTFDGCGKKFLDSSKLKRHYLTHTGERDFICPHEGCGKAFSLDFNLRSHMKIHSLENYHVCPYEDCGKRYTQEYKLKAHIKAHHEKNTVMGPVKHSPATVKKLQGTPKTPASVHGYASVDRPYACPYEGCEKAYIHEYKLKLHLRKEHPGYISEESGKHARTMERPSDDASDQDLYVRKGVLGKNPSRSKPNLMEKMPPAKVPQREGASFDGMDFNGVKKRRPTKEMYEEDSEETEEDNEDVKEDGWRFRKIDVDDEETEDED